MKSFEFITYLYLFYSISERREILKAQYHFACDCASCNRQDLVEFQERFSALRCHHCGGPIQNPTSEATLAHSMPCFDCGKIQVSAAFTQCFQLYLFHNTVKSEFVAAATNHFDDLYLRPLFKGGYYLRAATNSTFQKLASENSRNLPKLANLPIVKG